MKRAGSRSGSDSQRYGTDPRTGSVPECHGSGTGNTAVENLFSFTKLTKKFVKHIRQAVAILVPEPVLKICFNLKSLCYPEQKMSFFVR